MTDHPLRISPAVRASISADGLVLLDVRGGLVLAANAVGARIWQLLEARCARPDIERHLADEFGAPPDRIHRDVLAFLAELESRGLVTGEPR